MSQSSHRTKVHCSFKSLTIANEKVTFFCKTAVIDSPNQLDLPDRRKHTLPEDWTSKWRWQDSISLSHLTLISYSSVSFSIVMLCLVLLDSSRNTREISSLFGISAILLDFDNLPLTITLAGFISGIASTFVG